MDLTYKKSGVNIGIGDDISSSIASKFSNKRPEVLSGMGGFAALIEIPSKYKQAVMVSSTDGVGTKLKLAMHMGMHETIGIDLVAMCVNDILVYGAEPLYFLDYYACSKLDKDLILSVLTGINEGCLQAGCSLVGGETAELPSFFESSDYDIAGFTVGIVDKPNIINGSNIMPGDLILGLASSGFHSNGYSLIRSIINKHQSSVSNNLLSALLEPTRIYVKSILNLVSKLKPKGMAHITGGGIAGNLSRIIPQHSQALINRFSWTWPRVYDDLFDLEDISESEKLKVFNCGIGYIVIINKEDLELAKAILSETEQVFELGSIVSNTENEALVKLI